MENPRFGVNSLSPDQIDSIDMTVAAEIAALKADGVITYGDKYAFIYDAFGGGKDDTSDPLLLQKKERLREERARKLFHISGDEVSAIFKDEVSQDLKRKIDKITAFASILFRLEERDYARTLKTFTTKFPTLRKSPASKFSPDRSFEDCIRQGDTDFLLLNYELLLAHSHEEI